MREPKFAEIFDGMDAVQDEWLFNSLGFGSYANELWADMVATPLHKSYLRWLIKKHHHELRLRAAAGMTTNGSTIDDPYDLDIWDERPLRALYLLERFIVGQEE